jgi:gliding motility-associated-like protein
MPATIRYITLSLLLLLAQVLFAQKEAGIWYFGWNAGLDFNSGTPVVLNGGQIHTLEGVATISNSSGNLLFYTDGMTVWNRLHQPMPNGTGLFSHTSSTQSAIIVPKIGDASRFYVFTIEEYGTSQRLHYSMVNMNLDSGRGDLEAKNILMISGVSEKLTAVRHCNQRDIWIITHSNFGNTYYAFLVDPSGVRTTPVVSQTGASLLGASVGYLKASPDGRKLAAANWTMNADISDFNNITGVVSNTYSLFPNSSDTSYRVYGVEFSPNGKLLYVSTQFNISAVNIVNRQFGDFLLQYDVSLPTPAAIRASGQVIAKQLWLSNFMALQMAIDGKMYMAKFDQREIAAINHPNVYGPGCGYVAAAVQFTAPQKSMAGFPNFIQSYFFQRDSFSYAIDCPGNKVHFYKKTSGAGESFVWDFGDPSSGANNSSTLETPTHVYASPGPHTVQLITYTPCGPDTLRQVVQTHGLQLDLGADTLVCGVGPLQLNAGSSGTYQYRWQDGSSNPTYLVASPGTYWVEIKNPLGCTLRDSIRVDYDHTPGFSLGPDQMICPGSTVYLKPDLDPSWQLRWQDGSSAPDYTISQPGLYSLRASNDCGSVQDEVLVYQGVCKVFVPTAFTPNRDGKNDLFKILGTENVSSLRLKIFNRWGEVVFQTSDKAKGWDGTYRGKYVPNGTYIYLLDYTDTTSLQPQHLKGSFVLIR